MKTLKKSNLKKLNTEVILASDKPIGVFDSGIGGLTVVKEIMEKLPNESIIYFGDTARVPYGNKSKETIIKYAREIANFFLTQDVKLIVVACNTASALALKDLNENFHIPIIGVIKPGVNAALLNTKNNKIGVIGTKATIKSKIYNNSLISSNKDIIVFSKSCPLFVPLIEEGLVNHQITKETIKYYLKEFKENKVDTLILGCTHYPLLSSAIEEYLGSNIKLINPAFSTAKSLEKELLANNLNSKKQITDHKFYVSDDPLNFDREAKKTLLNYRARAIKFNL